MSTIFTHTVATGESPAVIAARYGIDWAAIKAHPKNAFIAKREARGGYPLYPGDRLAIPNRELPAHWQEHALSVQGHLSYLWSLVTQHPSYPFGVKLYSMGPPAKPQTTTPSTAPRTASAASTPAVQGYNKQHDRIWSKVILTTSIESAFEVLLPYLPTSAVMTSGYRSDADQTRVINDYYIEKGGDRAVTDVEQRRQWLMKEKGLKIARVGHSPHRTGLAFDLSGADIDVMDSAVNRCFAENKDTFPLHSTLREKNQNCLHVNLTH